MSILEVICVNFALCTVWVSGLPDCEKSDVLNHKLHRDKKYIYNTAMRHQLMSCFHELKMYLNI